MEIKEGRPADPVVLTEQFGLSLARSSWSVDEAITQMAIALTGLRSEAEVVAKDVQELSWNAGRKQLRFDEEKFEQIVRLTTKGIIYREDPDTEPQLDRPPVLPEGATFEMMLANTTEGVVWIDPEAELWREKITTQTGILLKAFINGLDKGGFSKKKTKNIMRNEIEETLDYLATRTSYSAYYQMPILVMIMSSAGLNNLRTTAHWGRRFHTMWQTARGK